MVAHGEHRPLRRQGPRLVGSGAVDMKGAAVMQLMALLLLARNKTPLARDLVFCGVVLIHLRDQLLALERFHVQQLGEA